MADTKTERSRAITTDIDGMRKQWFDEGFKAGADAERARIQAVEEQAMPGHEDLIAKLKFDGKTTGGQAAVQILAAEKRNLSGIAADLRTDAGIGTANSPTEDTACTTQKVDATMSQEQVEAIAKQEWDNNPNLHQEFSGSAQYVAFRKAEASGRVRVLNKRRVN
jgi:hypothetical protein